MLRKTVLVVEDDEHLRTIFAANLTIAGFVVREAADGLAALRLIDSAPPDLVVLDLGLPNVTGQGVLAEIRAHPNTRDVPVIVVTGSDVSASSIDADSLLRKPVDPSDLIRLVKRCLGFSA